MPIINYVYINFANNRTDYESGRYNRSILIKSESDVRGKVSRDGTPH